MYCSTGEWWEQRGRLPLDLDLILATRVFFMPPPLIHFTHKPIETPRMAIVQSKVFHLFFSKTIDYIFEEG